MLKYLVKRKWNMRRSPVGNIATILILFGDNVSKNGNNIISMFCYFEPPQKIIFAWIADDFRLQLIAENWSLVMILIVEY